MVVKAVCHRLPYCPHATPYPVVDQPAPGGAVILTDDFSSDRTVEIARRLDLTLLVHDENRGYGGNQKTCYRAALEAGTDIVIMLHPITSTHPC